MSLSNRFPGRLRMPGHSGSDDGPTNHGEMPTVAQPAAAQKPVAAATQTTTTWPRPSKTVRVVLASTLLALHCCCCWCWSFTARRKF